MVREMVGSKSGTVWDSNWDVGKDGKQPICHWRPERQVMRDLMDCEEKVLV